VKVLQIIKWMLPTHSKFMRLLLIILIELLALIPLGFRSKLGNFFGYLFFLIPTKERKIALLQINWILKDNGTEIIKNVYKNLGQNIFESLNLSSNYFKNYRVNITEISSITNTSSPCILLSAHTGNWDALASFLHQQGVPLLVIGKTARNKYFQLLLEHIRNKNNINTLWRGSSKDTKELIKILKNNGVIGTLIDQDLHLESVWSNFMGHPAKYPVSLIRMGLKFGAKFYTCFSYQEDDQKIVELEVITSSDIESILSTYNKRLEKIIKRHPDQWVWMHKRWRSINQTTTFSSKEYLEFLTNASK
jgi:KDO2-lipid IV(A) lauroyltransferase